MKKCNGVFEGGGVRGIGHVGAACGMEEGGYEFVNLAGSSAGAIVASLLAAGYKCAELREEMERLDYMKIKGKDWIDYFGAVGKTISILLTFGIYNTDYIECWLDGLLKRKNRQRFGDIKESGRILKITASDLTERRLLILPDDLKEFGVEPDSFSVAAAVKMSVSIPVFFEPVRWKDGYGKKHLIADGGLLSNYPVWVLDDGKKLPDLPTFGFKFVDEKETAERIPNQGMDIADYLKSIVSTCLDALDNSHLSQGDFDRTIRIPPRAGMKPDSPKIRATDFNISRADSQALFENGRLAARQFLRTWDFKEWKRKYRSMDRE